ncbi:MAG: hypothetical protein IPG22_19960 [Acidobacteria bacterium]|nr:hypothetical protein [Acidobacteriota bacterium]
MKFVSVRPFSSALADSREHGPVAVGVGATVGSVGIPSGRPSRRIPHFDAVVVAIGVMPVPDASPAVLPDYRQVLCGFRFC